ncbi:class I SAM-dependent methyltransferase [Longimicrobium sp.]|uniref:class I SAM-dependent methyltransferase n=1 Tax=Longimicrobium sp. TaxID=2029185 RepID=UPI003B3A0B08
MPGPEDFYDALAPFYHLIFPDWEASIARQAAALDQVIRAEADVGGERTVLDLACGIGTQALGLAALGYRVTASDLSPGAVRRLRDEAARRGLTIDAKVADMRWAWDAHGRVFDIVLCADNALPHLLTDGEILDALRDFRRCTAPGGICLVSIRDYESIDLQTARMHPHGVREEDGARWVLFQVWDPRPPLYETSMYVVEDRGGAGAQTRVMRATYYALPVPRLIELMREAGFDDVRRLDGAFYQPLVIGRRPAHEG